MEPSLERLLETLVTELLGEGERVLRAKALIAARAAVNVLRRLLLLQYVVISLCFLCSMSLFLGAYLIIDAASSGALRFTTPLGFCLGVFAMSGALLYFTVRESAWMRAFGLEERARKTQGGLSPEEVALIVERALDKRFGPAGATLPASVSEPDDVPPSDQAA